MLQTSSSLCWVNIVVNGILDHEDQSDHSITVRVTDPAGNSLVKKFVVKIVDINDPPAVGLNDSVLSWYKHISLVSEFQERAYCGLCC